MESITDLLDFGVKYIFKHTLLGTRILNGLDLNNIHTVRDLVLTSQMDLRRTPNIGNASMESIEEELIKLHPSLHLGMTEDEILRLPPIPMASTSEISPHIDNTDKTSPSLLPIIQFLNERPEVYELESTHVALALAIIASSNGLTLHDAELAYKEGLIDTPEGTNIVEEIKKESSTLAHDIPDYDTFVFTTARTRIAKRNISEDTIVDAFNQIADVLISHFPDLDIAIQYPVGKNTVGRRDFSRRLIIRQP